LNRAAQHFTDNGDSDRRNTQDGKGATHAPPGTFGSAAASFVRQSFALRRAKLIHDCQQVRPQSSAIQII